MNRLSNLLRGILAVAVLGIAGIGAAQAAVFVGTWDPRYGKPFDSGPEVLGWRGSARFEIPDQCIFAGTVDSDDCLGMQLIDAQVTFYDYVNGPEIAIFNYATADLDDFSATFDAGGGLTSLTSDFFTSRQPVGTSFSIIDFYSFSLQFVADGVRMYHTKDYEIVPFDIGPFSPAFCGHWRLPTLVCGFSGSYSDGSSAPAVHVSFNRVPEPGSLLLIAAAVLAAGFTLRLAPRRLARRRGR
jgi:hypothetical protein